MSTEDRITDIENLFAFDQEEVTPAEGVGIENILSNEEEQTTPEEVTNALTDIAESIGILPVEKAEPTVKVKSENTAYNTLARKLLAGVETIKNTDGEEVPFEDFEFTEDNLAELVALNTEAVKEEASRDKVSLDGMSDLVKKIIEVDKNKGDFKGLLAIKTEFLDPLDAFDMDTIEGQKGVLFMQLQAKRYSEEDADALVRMAEANGTLEDKALQANVELHQLGKEAIDKRVAAAEENAIYRKESIKKYKKDAKEQLGRSYELKETVKDKLVGLLTKEVAGGFEIDTLYKKQMENPLEAAELALFLYDREEYKKQVAGGAVIASQLKEARTLQLGSRSAVDRAVMESNKKESGVIPLDI